MYLGFGAEAPHPSAGITSQLGQGAVNRALGWFPRLKHDGGGGLFRGDTPSRLSASEDYFPA